jgi:branched-chain amino acid transport system ATP-binding protein
VALALEIRDLRKSFGGLPAISGVSLAVDAGERRLLLGPNGAGKTTLFNLVCGEIRRDGGAVHLFGQDVEGCRPDELAHRGLARTYQIITLFPRHTLVENAVLALLGTARTRWNPFAVLRRRRDLWDRARGVLARVGLEASGDKRVTEAAYGELRRLEIAMALAQSPRLLLLDEPMAGLSREERHDMQRVLASIPRALTILMIEHDMEVALDFADRITVLHYGQVIVEGTRAEIVADARVREIYLGTEADGG